MSILGPLLPDYAAGVAAGGGGGGDVTPPTVTVVSTPTTAAGAFVVDITDAAPGLAYLTVTCRLAGEGGDERVLYRRGIFKTPFITSYVEAIANGYRLHAYRTGGWPTGTTTFDVDAVDGDGNDEGA